MHVDRRTHTLHIIIYCCIYTSHFCFIKLYYVSYVLFYSIYRFLYCILYVASLLIFLALFVTYLTLKGYIISCVENVHVYDDKKFQMFFNVIQPLPCGTRFFVSITFQYLSVLYSSDVAVGNFSNLFGMFVVNGLLVWIISNYSFFCDIIDCVPEDIFKSFFY